VLPGLIDAHINMLTSGISHVMAADCALTTIAAIKDE
jgi:imidazolonepropionase-like amidohydrolase